MSSEQIFPGAVVANARPKNEREGRRADAAWDAGIASQAHRSEDLRLRMRLGAVLQLSFKHLLSGLDDSSTLGDAPCGTSTLISGYTEWTASDLPDVSVGWDWVLRTLDGRVEWSRAGLPRSNLLLVDLLGQPYARAKNDAVLATVVDAIRWQEIASRCILGRLNTLRSDGR